jgi:hypothetical protein
MTTTIPEPPADADRESEIAKARADVMHRAEGQGIKPFTSLEDFAGDVEMTADLNVDEFLQQVRKDRDRPSSGSGN